jgi:hypothetical protein
VYKIESELSAERYYKLQEFMLELSVGSDAASFVKNVNRAFEALNAQGGPKVADAVVALSDTRRGFQSFGERRNTVVKACCLFLNDITQDESRRMVFDEADINAKAADLEAVCGFAGFFSLLEIITSGLKQS